VKLSVTEQASKDVVRMFQEGLERFGPKQAIRYADGLEKAYQQIVQFPKASREREELTPQQRVFRYRAHLIFYQLTTAEIIITRVRHGREDWQAE